MHLGRIAVHQRVIRRRACDDRASADERKTAYGHIRQDDRTRANRCAVAYGNRPNCPVIVAFELTVRSDRSGEFVVTEANMWPDEDAIANRYTMVDRDVILNLGPSANRHPKIDVYVLAENTLRADAGAL